MNKLLIIHSKRNLQVNSGKDLELGDITLDYLRGSNITLREAGRSASEGKDIRMEAGSERREDATGRGRGHETGTAGGL